MASSLADGLEAQFKKSFPDGWAAIGATGARPLRNAAEKALSDVAASVLGAPAGSRRQATETAAGGSGETGGRRSSEAHQPEREGARGRSSTAASSSSSESGTARKLLDRISTSPLTQQAVQEGIKAALEAKLGPGLAGKISTGAGHAFSGAMRMLAAHEAQKNEAPTAPDLPERRPRHEASTTTASRNGRPVEGAAQQRAADPVVGNNRPRGEQSGNPSPAEPVELDGSPRPASGRQGGSRAETFAPMSPAELSRAGLFRRPPNNRPLPPPRSENAPAGAFNAAAGTGDTRDADTQTQPHDGLLSPQGGEAPHTRPDEPGSSSSRPDALHAAGGHGNDPPRDDAAPHGDGHVHGGSDDVYSKHEAAMNRVLERQLNQELSQMRRQVMMDQLKHVGHLFQSAGDISH